MISKTALFELGRNTIFERLTGGRNMGAGCVSYKRGMLRSISSEWCETLEVLGQYGDSSPGQSHGVEDRRAGRSQLVC
jgi:hypothetical protein